MFITAYQWDGLVMPKFVWSPCGVKQTQQIQLWSAIPTPLTTSLKVDLASVEKMTEAAVADGMKGVFLAGTCGEGPWLPRREKIRLIQEVVRVARGRLVVAAQVSDNSVPRILDNIAEVAEAGAGHAIIAPAATMMNVTGDRIAALFGQAAAESPLPVGIYDLGERRPFGIPTNRLKEICLLENVRLVKDSSCDPLRREIALAVRKERPALDLLNGDEFRCVDYLEAGYNGCMFGGAAAIAPHLRDIVELFQAGKLAEARKLDEEMKTILYGIYGGQSIACWLTGLKYYMVRRGIFATPASFLEYPLTAECRAFIDDYAVRQKKAG